MARTVFIKAEEVAQELEISKALASVSYTHLTLPTKLEV